MVSLKLKLLAKWLFYFQSWKLFLICIVPSHLIWRCLSNLYCYYHYCYHYYLCPVLDFALYDRLLWLPGHMFVLSLLPSCSCCSASFSTESTSVPSTSVSGITPENLIEWYECFLFDVVNIGGRLSSSACWCIFFSMLGVFFFDFVLLHVLTVYYRVYIIHTSLEILWC